MATLHISDPLVLRVLAFVADQGRPAWLVGGFVRDQLLGRPLHDLDLVVPDGGIALARALARAFGGAFFVLDEARDVARTILNRDGVPLTVDVAQLRASDLATDLALRDFTINALAVAVASVAGPAGGLAELIDPLGGREDIERGLLRAVSSEAFVDDPLRTLRGVRLAVELGFRLDETTAALIRRDARLLKSVAAERVRDELMRIVGVPGGWRNLRLLAQLDQLRPTLPEAQDLMAVTQSEPHYLDVFDHTRAVMVHAEALLALLWPGGRYEGPPELARQLAEPSWAIAVPDMDPGQAPPADPIVLAPAWQWASLADVLAPFADALARQLLQPLASGRTRRDWFLWAALTHDWGKPRTRSAGADWRIHFYGHEQQGAALVGERLRLLACASNEAEYLARMVELHMRPGHLARHAPPSSRALYRFFHDAEDIGPDVVLLALADKMATRAPHAEADSIFWNDLLAVARQVFEAYFNARTERVNPVPFLDGRQVMAELNLAPGPQVGHLLEGLREAQAIGEVTSVDEARTWLHEHR